MKGQNKILLVDDEIDAIAKVKVGKLIIYMQPLYYRSLTVSSLRSTKDKREVTRVFYGVNKDTFVKLFSKFATKSYQGKNTWWKNMG